MPPTPIRHIRIPDDLWQQLNQTAKDTGIPIAALVRVIIRNYLTATTPTPPNTSPPS